MDERIKHISRKAALRRADTAFSIFIRTRDSQEYQCKAFKCISCGRVLPIQQCDCGHYVNRSHNSLRYSEKNCNAQCRHCNRFDEGNQQGYRRGLIEKYGERDVLLLEAAKYRRHSLSTSVLLDIEELYKLKIRQFKYRIK